MFGFGGAATGGTARPTADADAVLQPAHRPRTAGQVVPIDAGGRLTGTRRPLQRRRCSTSATGEDAGARRAATNFSVVRVQARHPAPQQRRRAADRPVARGASAAGATAPTASTATFAFFANLNDQHLLGADAAPTAVSGDDTSYRAQLDYTGDRYGLQLERLAVGDDFNPEVGFVRRDDMRRNFGEVRFSPRLQRVPTRSANCVWSGSTDYIENGAGALETREQQGEFGIEFQNGDSFRRRAHAAPTSSCPRPFAISRGVDAPVGGYDYGTRAVGYNIGQQRRAVGAAAGRTRHLLQRPPDEPERSAAAASTCRRSCRWSRPTSVNRVRLAEGPFTTPPGRHRASPTR